MQASRFSTSVSSYFRCGESADGGVPGALAGDGDPQTGKAYDLDSGYGHTYQSTTDGTIVQTNSAYSPGDASLWTVLTPR